MSSQPFNIEERIELLKSEIRERQELLTAYERVAADINKPASSAQSANGTKPKDRVEIEPGFQWRESNPSRVVRTAIAHMTNDYTLNDIDAWLKREQYEIDRDKISFALSRFARTKEIKVKEKGAGKRPTIFEAPEIPAGRTIL